MGRQSMKRTTTLVSPEHAEANGLPQQPTVRGTFHEHEPVLLVLEDLAVHDVEVVAEHLTYFCLTVSTRQTGTSNLEIADDVERGRALEIESLQTRVEHQEASFR